jgi:hypothetical protein
MKGKRTSANSIWHSNVIDMKMESPIRNRVKVREKGKRCDYATQL